jgi:putative ABC transport system permease protein
MIGLALVTTALVVGQSIKSTIGSTFEKSSKADYYISDDLDEVDFPSTLASQIRQSDAVAAATGFTKLKARIDGKVSAAVGFDFDQVGSLFDAGVTAGGFDAKVTDPVVVAADKADSLGAHVGDVLPIEFANGSTVDATVVGLFDDQSVLTQDYLFDTSVLSDAGIDPTANWLAVALADGASKADVDSLVAGLSSEFPYAAVETSAQFSKRVEGQVDQILAMANVMVALAVIIALIGIANTLALSVFERTRELGLVRAVGMTRRQLRRMIRFEAALVATFGATLGVGLGLLFGFGVVGVLPASLAGGLSIPIVQIVVLMIVAAGAGVVAAWMPARRAGRLNVLEAIAF